MKQTSIKQTISAFIGLVATWMGEFWIAIMICAVATVMDIASGTLVAVINKEWESEKSILGMIKKLKNLIFVILGYGIDFALAVYR